LSNNIYAPFGYRHGIAEILLKLVLISSQSINQSIKQAAIRILHPALPGNQFLLLFLNNVRLSWEAANDTSFIDAGLI
jgi:hypothetical protein